MRGDWMDYKYDIALSFATEDQKLVEKVYHYLRAENLNVFFAPSQEGQKVLSGKNQREVFYSIFGLEAEYVALFVSQNYSMRQVPMEEAGIAFAKHGADGHVIPVYLDGTGLPKDMLDPQSTNYFEASDPAVIASHLAAKIAMDRKERKKLSGSHNKTDGIMNINGNTANKQIFIQTMEGSIEL